VPGAGKCYQFDDADNLKAAMRLKLDPSMADEAKVCFNFATQFFKEMMEIAIINKYCLGHADRSSAAIRN
jgi:hypothetical protein